MGVSRIDILYLSSTLNTDSENISIDYDMNGRCLVVRPSLFLRLRCLHSLNCWILFMDNELQFVNKYVTQY